MLNVHSRRTRRGTITRLATFHVDDDEAWFGIRLATSMFGVQRSEFDVFHSKSEKSPPNLSVKQGQIGGWEFAMLSFPCRR
jgi:hypothetical protein